MLYIVRHAWAGYFGDPAWPDDSQRPLTDKGKERFAKVVEILTDREFLPQVIATSPYVRCRQTAEIIADICPTSPNIIVIEELAPAGESAGLLQWTAEQAVTYEQIAWVGHAPDVGHLTAALIGNGDSWVRFAKGAVAAIEFEDDTNLSEGELRWLTTAKILGC